MSRKRPRKFTLATGKKCKRYYESRTGVGLTIYNEEIDFSIFPSFNVDFDAVMSSPIHNEKSVRATENKYTQTGIKRSSQSMQTSQFSKCQSIQTEICETSPKKSHSAGEDLMKVLKKDDIWERFAEKLTEKRQINPFVKLTTALASNKM